jgi:hypothetical protein
VVATHESTVSITSQPGDEDVPGVALRVSSVPVRNALLDRISSRSVTNRSSTCHRIARPDITKNGGEQRRLAVLVPLLA